MKESSEEAPRASVVGATHTPGVSEDELVHAAFVAAPPLLDGADGAGGGDGGGLSRRCCMAAKHHGPGSTDPK
jgi:hypothetical protein